ncbi:anthranilate phosphoribosyltransferase [Marinospirillum alkaliphilum]|uniref:Anthranilate phosphoribosyltransferase n=1 Tax=Marinospirillum alkaliphilum DSM 21637 TaxID=1122209 RepID=A0A1K1ZEV2_9GAMM|nr:anthranilate phosphoribosyltransferase [Marinospirillum alkaliphilum]SFX72227.1 anthranilate phosphoribosyltransferase [Marinospirillum alkaliphilum DSM 21637]
MDMKQAIDAVTRRQDLTREQMRDVMQLIMTGEATAAQMGGFLVGLRMKGETVDEITAAAEVMRNLATPVQIKSDRLVDIVGTGGDGANLFNVSTCACLVVAAAGGQVAKHGNRSVSSSSGSADLLEAAGVHLAITPEQVARCVEELGVGFMFAPQHHSAMKHAIGPRREMGVRTLFNILGPLTNPAGAQHQLLGVYTPELVRPLAEVLGNLGLKHALVVSGEDGLDEISIAGPTHVAEYRNGQLSEYTIQPEDFGLTRHSLDALKVGSASESLELIRQVLKNQQGPALDMVLLNAGAALYAADIADSIIEGVALAQDAIASGQAAEKLKVLVNFTQSLA